MEEWSAEERDYWLEIDDSEMFWLEQEGLAVDERLEEMWQDHLDWVAGLENEEEQ